MSTADCVLPVQNSLLWTVNTNNNSNVCQRMAQYVQYVSGYIANRRWII